MKAKTSCPQCEQILLVDISGKSEECDIVCSNCNHRFKIKPSNASDLFKKSKECSWEECGEPRKTVLSKLKRHSNRPLIVSFLLLTTGVLGFFSAVYFGTTNGPIFNSLGIISNFLAILSAEKILVTSIVLLCSVIAVIGSFTAYLRRYFWITVICSIIAIFTIGFLVGSILAVVALIIMFLSKEEFDMDVKCRFF